MHLLILLLGLLIAAPAHAVQNVEVVETAPMPVWVMNDPSTSVIAAQFRFEGGISRDPAAQSGAASLLSDVMLRGAGGRDAAAFAEDLRDHGIDISVDVGRDDSFVSLVAPADEWSTAMARLRDVLTAPRLDAGEISRARAETLAVLRDQPSDPNWRAQRIVNGLTFAGSPYERPGIGTPSTVSRLERPELAAAHGRIFKARPVGAVFTGAIDRTQAEQALKIFETLPAPVPDKAGDYRKLDAPRSVYHEFNVQQASLTYVLPGLDRRSPDYPALAVLDALLADGFGSRLMKEFREETGLSYGIQSGLSSPEHGATWQFSLQVPPDKADEAADRLRRIIGETAKIGFKAQEVEKARESLANALTMGWTSSAAAAAQLSAAQHDGLGPDYLETWQERLRAVTPGDIQRVAARVTQETKGLVVVVSPRKPADDGWETLAKLPGLE